MKEPRDKILERIARQGFDAVEMFGEPSTVDLKVIAETFHSFNIPVCGVTGMWGSVGDDGWKRRLLSLNSDIVDYSIGYVKSCIIMCQGLGGHEVNLCLFADDKSAIFDKNHGVVPEDQKKHMLKRSIPILTELSKYARDHDVHLLLEPLNRYNTPFCTSSMDAISIAQELNQDNFGVLLDTFHMNIEEHSFADAISQCGGRLRHTHFADNNREMPGNGHIDFRSIVGNLCLIGYSDFISFEPILTETNYKSDTLKGLKYCKKIERFET